jgi:hypothetical protein
MLVAYMTVIEVCRVAKNAFRKRVVLLHASTPFHSFIRSIYNARNGNLELPVYFLKAKRGYIVTKKKDKWT